MFIIENYNAMYIQCTFPKNESGMLDYVFILSLTCKLIQEYLEYMQQDTCRHIHMCHKIKRKYTVNLAVLFEFQTSQWSIILHLWNSKIAWDNYAPLQMISEYFPARGWPLSRVKKRSSFVEFEWRSALHVRLHEVVTILDLNADRPWERVR